MAGGGVIHQRGRSGFPGPLPAPVINSGNRISPNASRRSEITQPSGCASVWEGANVNMNCRKYGFFQRKAAQSRSDYCQCNKVLDFQWF
jgi:hypothetical protein